MFDYYSKKGNIYIWFDNKLKDKFQFHFEEVQFMDRDDNPISKQRFDEFRKHPILGFIFDEEELKIMKNPELAYAYAVKRIKDRWPEAEPYIMNNPNKAAKYAEKIIRGRWPEAEPYIMKDYNSSLYYVRYVIKDRWPELESYINNDPSDFRIYLYQYLLEELNAN
jgi:hypothetical protein